MFGLGKQESANGRVRIGNGVSGRLGESATAVDETAREESDRLQKGFSLGADI